MMETMHMEGAMDTRTGTGEWVVSVTMFCCQVTESLSELNPRLRWGNVFIFVLSGHCQLMSILPSVFTLLRCLVMTK